MDASAVAEYLKQHPDFFEDYADIVAEIFVPHPHGGHAIPIAERQILTLRDKIRDLERQLAELIRHGTENDVISEKLHRSTLALFAAPRPRDDAGRAVAQPEGGFRAYRRSRCGSGARVRSSPTLPELAATFRPRFATTRTTCADPTAAPRRHVRVARVVRGRRVARLVRLPAVAHRRPRSACSPSPAATPQRFHSAMGTVYLLRLAELASMAIARFLPAS